PPAGRLLDAGCGAGVLTCAYALALPDAEVIGVDAVPEAVACAEELARRVGAANATFVVGDCAAPPPGREFDQIVAVTALGDAGLYPADRPGRDPFSAVTEVDGPGRDFTSPGIAALAERLGAGGSFLVFDRTPYAPQAVWLGAALLHAGVDLDLDLRRSGVETLTEEGEKITFTRFAGTRGGGGAPGPTTTGDLAAWLKAAAPPAYGAVWHDELRFEELKARGAELVWAAEVSYAPYSPVRERREVWADGTAVYGWVTTTLGLQELTRGRSPDTVVAEYAAYARERAASGLQVRRYGA
ncbi:MAG TPA: class I SAM-dependent methyltransferase, partial [Acidimicrobiia bacterium]|nr:class I SAM-dependent methyltransferase [Acidimicrobiia bacterium]